MPAGLVAGLDTLSPRDRRRFGAALDETQIESKLWLIEQLHRYCPVAGSSVVVLGAWYGVLPMLVNWRLAHTPSRMLCIDRDAAVCAEGERVIGAAYDNITYRVQDVHDLDYRNVDDDIDHADIVINTICEHLPDIRGWWERLSAGQLVVLQSNNYLPCPDHVNCVYGIEEMKRQTPMSELVFAGTLQLPVLDRFMLIGRR